MASGHGKIAKRYAAALFELCEPASLEAVRDALKEIAELWLQSDEFQDALRNPALTSDARIGILRDLAARYPQKQEILGNFLAVLLENRRLDELPMVASIFASMVAELRKMLSLEISSAFELSEGERTEIAAKVKADFGSLATIEWNTQPELIGGLRIKAGDKLLDHSIQGSLERMRSALEGGR